MAEIIKGTAVTFGTGGAAATLITSASVNKSSSKKEIPDGNGGFGAVVYYAVKDDINFETYAATSPDVGDEETLPSIISSYVSGLVIVTSSESIESSEDLTKSTVTAVAYAGITA
jgi:hypothetical protein